MLGRVSILVVSSTYTVDSVATFGRNHPIRHLSVNASVNAFAWVGRGDAPSCELLNMQIPAYR